MFQSLVEDALQQLGPIIFLRYEAVRPRETGIDMSEFVQLVRMLTQHSVADFVITLRRFTHLGGAREVACARSDRLRMGDTGQRREMGQEIDWELVRLSSWKRFSGNVARPKSVLIGTAISRVFGTS